MQTKTENLEFLKRKVQEVRIAKFSAEINSVLQLPNNIITTLKADDEGHIWFFTSCNGTYASNMVDKSFYASLDYYQKGGDCRLHIDGNAMIIEDENNGQPLAFTKKENNFTYDLVLIKLTIIKAEYFENKHTIWGHSLKETIRNIYTELFLSSPHKQFNFLESY